jgi:hypothetical protein
MARKTALLKIKDEIPKDWLWQVDNLKKFEPVEGTEDQWNRYVTSVVQRLKQESRFAQACDNHDSAHTDESYKAMKAEGDLYSRRMLSELGALDAWRHACKHVDDKVAVAEDEVRAVVLASISDKLESLQFSVNGGILGSKVAQAIRKDVTEVELDAPLCQDCA